MSNHNGSRKLAKFIEGFFNKEISVFYGAGFTAGLSYYSNFSKCTNNKCKSNYTLFSNLLRESLQRDFDIPQNQLESKNLEELSHLLDTFMVYSGKALILLKLFKLPGLVDNSIMPGIFAPENPFSPLWIKTWQWIHMPRSLLKKDSAHFILSRMMMEGFISSVFTLNWDNLLEFAWIMMGGDLSNKYIQEDTQEEKVHARGLSAGKKLEVISTPLHLARRLRNNTCRLYKFNGDVDVFYEIYGIDERFIENENLERDSSLKEFSYKRLSDWFTVSSVDNSFWFFEKNWGKDYIRDALRGKNLLSIGYSFTDRALQELFLTVIYEMRDLITESVFLDVPQRFTKDLFEAKFWFHQHTAHRRDLTNIVEENNNIEFLLNSLREILKELDPAHEVIADAISSSKIRHPEEEKARMSEEMSIDTFMCIFLLIMFLHKISQEGTHNVLHEFLSLYQDRIADLLGIRFWNWGTEYETQNNLDNPYENPNSVDRFRVLIEEPFASLFNLYINALPTWLYLSEIFSMNPFMHFKYHEGRIGTSDLCNKSTRSNSFSVPIYTQNYPTIYFEFLNKRRFIRFLNELTYNLLIKDKKNPQENYIKNIYVSKSGTLWIEYMWNDSIKGLSFIPIIVDRPERAMYSANASFVKKQLSVLTRAGGFIPLIFLIDLDSFKNHTELAWKQIEKILLDPVFNQEMEYIGVTPLGKPNKYLHYFSDNFIVVPIVRRWEKEQRIYKSKQEGEISCHL